ncbi:MAG TPA: CHASE domain-containing protein [Tepidiformaceae bacterium]|nr:CHASE domain-containing protein [Tepidiformaceae bacterium]
MGSATGALHDPGETEPRSVRYEGGGLAVRVARSRLLRMVTPGFVLLLGASLAIVTFVSVSSRERHARDEHLDRVVDRITAAVEARVATYEDAMRSGAALFAADPLVTHDEWQRFSASLDLTGRYPGVNGIGVVLPVKAAEITEFEADAQREMPGFAVRSFGQIPDDDLHMVIAYIEPLATNREAHGLDIGSEPLRRAAAERARDLGHTAITDRVTLVQDKMGRPGFLMYVPVYSSGSVPATVGERRAQLTGWIYAPFVTEPFLTGVVGSMSREVRLEVRELDSRAADPVVYSEGGRLTGSSERTRVIDIGGRSFALDFERGPAFTHSASLAGWMAGVILLVTLVLGFLAARLQNAARRGWEVALRRQEELAQAASRTEAAERAAEHRGEIVNLASHELRNPLAVLSLSAELMEAEAEATGMADLAETARAARTAAARAEALVAELLDLNRIDSGRLELAVRPVDVGPMLREVSEMAIAHWGDRRVSLSELPGTGAVLADPDRLRIILRNLVDNAARHSAEGGPIAVSVQAEGQLVSVTVEDDGPGIAPAEAGTIFERFRRRKGSHAGGIGIGLYLSRELARRMAGDVELVGSERGARFRLTLPSGARTGMADG